MQLDLIHNDQPLSLAVHRHGDALSVRLPDGSERRITSERLPSGLLQIHERDRTFRIAVARIGAETHVSYDGRLYVFETPAAEDAGPVHRATGDLAAPMPGVVADVLVKPGDHVTTYQAIAVVEAMKVMATVEAPFAGVVSEVLVEKGQRVQQREKLAVITPEESGGE